MSDYRAKQGDDYHVYSVHELITNQKQHTSTSVSQQVKTGFRQSYVKPLVKYEEILPNRATKNREQLKFAHFKQCIHMHLHLKITL